MKYITEFRDGEKAGLLSKTLAQLAKTERTYRFMEFCGGHTHAISRYGLIDLLPANVKMIHGPGCPVCVLPIGRVDQAISLALNENVILCAYGDCLRVPASKGRSLLKARALGGDVRMVYSSGDALQLARLHPERQVVFFAIGFETTTPPTAVVIEAAQREGLSNFSVLCCHVLTPPAMRRILDAPQIEDEPAVWIDGFVGPAHVSTVIGTRPYEPVAQHYQKPVVIAGFEPLDVLQAIRMLLVQVNEGRFEVENEYTRAVVPEGNRKAQALVAKVFTLRPSFEWRGLGTLAHSALAIGPEFADFDAEKRFDLAYHPVADHKACECGTILRGVKHPRECRLFGKACTPETPLGSCMVSSEGACAAYYTYGRAREMPNNPIPL
jgi:hydrogenase expression/formation protein HypD